MSRDTSRATAGGLSFGGLLTVVFITLKLVGVIDWPWLWVFAPVWAPAVAFLAFAGTALGLGLFIQFLAGRTLK